MPGNATRAQNSAASRRRTLQNQAFGTYHDAQRRLAAAQIRLLRRIDWLADDNVFCACSEESCVLHQDWLPS